ncbi:MAG: hypothetical protein A2V64_11005 [Bacteroidetes bacterium RBG_13_43_22]|nr:MAG: hypothetical protein A2V64_11005 [Bacteroidetes bacterium RBG_13_43_22]
MIPYVRDIIKCDPADTLQKGKCPVLAISGEKDLQASPNQNLSAMDKALKSGNDKNLLKILNLKN